MFFKVFVFIVINRVAIKLGNKNNLVFNLDNLFLENILGEILRTNRNVLTRS
jgi:hypothetical protein